MKHALFVLLGIPVLLLVSGCLSPHKELSGKYLVPTQVEVRSSFGTNQSFARMQRCDRATKPFYLWYSQEDFTNCVLLTKAEQDEWMAASSRGAGPEIVGAVIMGGSIGAGAALSGGAQATAGATAGATNIVNQSVTVGRAHRR